MQLASWFITLQIAFEAQLPGQGSLHLSLIHAKFERHSWLDRHSGRQLGGNPMWYGKHEHAARSSNSRHLL